MKTKINIFIIIAISFFFTQSCIKEKNESENSEAVSSSYNGNKSHNMGQNCMNCHKRGGPGEGFFSVAGTVYDSLKTTINGNGIVKLYTGVDGRGTLKATIQVDGNGNFYTTDNIDFTGGLYPSITGLSGDTRYMGSPIMVGQCNSCHGVSNDKIWVK